MTLSQSKKLSQLTADNAQWEDRQLLRSGAVKGAEVQMDFDEEDERKVILLVHGMCIFLYWASSLVFYVALYVYLINHMQPRLINDFCHLLINYLIKI